VGAAACTCSISAAWPRVRGEVGVQRERARGVFIGAAAWARGLGATSASDGSGGTVFGPVSSETTTDRWAPPVSI
jgi:hypothetical protein